MKKITIAILGLTFAIIPCRAGQELEGKSFIFTCSDRINAKLMSEDFYDFRWGNEPTNTVLFISRPKAGWDTSLIDIIEERFLVLIREEEDVSNVEARRLDFTSVVFNGKYLEFMVTHDDGSISWRYNFFIQYQDQEWKATLHTTSKTDKNKAFEILASARVSRPIDESVIESK